MLRKLFGREKWGKKNFETLLQSLSEGILVEDGHQKIQYMNKAFMDIFEIGNVATIFRPSSIKEIFSKYKMITENGKSVSWKSMPNSRIFKGEREPKEIVKFTNRQGKEFWVRIRSNAILDEDGSVKYSVGVYRDITERKLTEEQNAIRTNLLEAQGQVSNQGILAVDKYQNAIYVNARLAQIFDVPYEKMENKTVKHLFEIGKDAIKDFDKFSIKANVLGRSKTRKGRGVLMMKNGKVINYNTLVIENDRAEFLARLWFFEDKTSEYKLEEQRNTFINIATHELKTPLTTIRGYAEILKKKVEKNDFRKSKEYLSKIIDNTDKVTELVNDLLDINKVRLGSIKFKKQLFNIDELVSEVIEDFKKTGSHKFYKLGYAPKKIFADKTRIRQVLVNLIGNSIKYSPDNSSIRVAIKQDSLNTTVSIKDSGPGISDKDKEKIFQIYVRGRSKYKAAGLGIGLFISQTIVKGHGGKIWVDSTLGQGANFSFTIPSKSTSKKETGLLSLFK